VTDRLPNGTQALRCFCSSRPLLGVYGIDPKDGRAFVHIKVYKQSRVFGEHVFKSGELKTKCRVCYRWHHITIHENVIPRLKEIPAPNEPEIAGTPGGGVSSAA
jgi:hypothetical protein